MPPRRLVLFSGLALPPRFLAPQQAAGVDVTVCRWIEPQAGESLPDYGRRIARTVTPAQGLWLGGVSFGGMVALEAARHIPCCGVALIASCRAGSQLAPWLQCVLAAAHRTPLGMLRAGLLAAPLGIRVVGHPTRKQRRHLLALIPDMDLALGRWAAGAILNWRFDTPLPVPVHHLHGSLDRMIPLSRTRPTAVVSGAGHAMNVTHAPAVNTWLRQVMAGDLPHPAATAAFEKSR